jgi:hypothetical protein
MIWLWLLVLLLFDNGAVDKWRIARLASEFCLEELLEES